MLVVAEQVIARYLFSASSMALQELSWHLFSAIFLLGAADTFRQNGHVRVDILYANWSERRRALVDLLGILFFLLPMCALLIYHGFTHALQAYGYESQVARDAWTATLFGQESGGVIRTAFASLEGWLRDYLIRGEASPNSGGLGARWLVKLLIPVGFALLGLQALAQAAKHLRTVLRSQA